MRSCPKIFFFLFFLSVSLFGVTKVYADCDAVHFNSPTVTTGDTTTQFNFAGVVNNCKGDQQANPAIQLWFEHVSAPDGQKISTNDNFYRDVDIDAQGAIHARTPIAFPKAGQWHVWFFYTLAKKLDNTPSPLLITINGEQKEVACGFPADSPDTKCAAPCQRTPVPGTLGTVSYKCLQPGNNDNASCNTSLTIATAIDCAASANVTNATACTLNGGKGYTCSGDGTTLCKQQSGPEVVLKCESFPPTPDISYVFSTPQPDNDPPPCQVGLDKDNNQINISSKDPAVVNEQLKKIVKCLKTPSALGSLDTTPEGFVGKFFGILLSASGGVALALIIFAGYQLMTSQGEPEKVKEARERLTAAIVGLLFLVFSLVILEVIGVNILHLPGFCNTNDTQCATKTKASSPTVIPLAPTLTPTPAAQPTTAPWTGTNY